MQVYIGLSVDTILCALMHIAEDFILPLKLRQSRDVLIFYFAYLKEKEKFFINNNLLGCSYLILKEIIYETLYNIPTKLLRLQEKFLQKHYPLKKFLKSESIVIYTYIQNINIKRQNVLCNYLINNSKLTLI